METNQSPGNSPGQTGERKSDPTRQQDQANNQNQGMSQQDPYNSGYGNTGTGQPEQSGQSQGQSGASTGGGNQTQMGNPGVGTGQYPPDSDDGMNAQNNPSAEDADESDEDVADNERAMDDTTGSDSGASGGHS